ncbi:hypothetical protein V501_08969 [Pseudogymnoascus sp. VKM F-4519 (FW-2642)]|nr:hypothetical protein V501_08969 [Pseudogymnoascus sp. VKM F-4519 (FW-2642)]
MKPEDEHADAVVRVCSYHRIDFDLVTIRPRPYVTEAVQDLLQTAFEKPPTSGLGIFDYLPEEVMTMVLLNLDVLTFFRFRHVNRYARILSTTALEYQLVVKYGVEGMRALLRSDCARRFTMMHLHHLLITDTCGLCGNFAGFLFLLTATRCCFRCLESSPKLRVISTTKFAKRAGISTSQLSKSYGSTLRTVSGIYSVFKQRDRRPKKLILKADAIAALAKQAVFKKNLIAELLKSVENYEKRYMACIAFPTYNRRTGKFEPDVSCKGCHVHATRKIGGYGDDRRVFSTAGFLSHFATCVEARKIWAESKEGTVRVHDSAFILRGGSSFGLE